MGHARELGGLELVWRLNNTVIRPDGFHFDVQDAGRRLLVKNPEAARQAGIYSCQARRGIASSAPREAWLHIHEPPIITSPLPEATRGSVGGAVELRCPSDGAPPPTVAWFKDGASLAPTLDCCPNEAVVGLDGSLLLPSLSADQAGLYQCERANAAGSALSSTWLQASTSGPLLTLKPANASVPAGSAARLECAAAGAPAPTLRWSLAGVGEIQPDDVNYRLEDGSLVIPSASQGMSGWYTCTATNSQGSSQAKAFLSVAGSLLFFQPSVTRPVTADISAGRAQIVQGPTDQAVVIGSNVLFPCEVIFNLFYRD